MIEFEYQYFVASKWQNGFSSAQFNMAAPSHMWLLSTWDVADWVDMCCKCQMHTEFQRLHVWKWKISH